MKAVDMKKKICPIMSRPVITQELPSFILCQGSACLAFGSRHTYEFLGKNGKPTVKYQDRTHFDPKIQTRLIKETVSLGWEQQGSPPGSPGGKVSFRREGEPDCWCDAMAGNAQCGYEAP